MGDGGYGAASGGACSSVKDLVKLYSSFIKSINSQFSGSAIPNDVSPSSLVLFHQGSLPGSLIFVALLPETETVILILTNSLALNDTADWIGQMIIEEIVNVPSELKPGFVGMAEATVAENLKWYPLVVDELVRRGRRVGRDQGATFWKVKFEASESASINKLIWAPGSELPPIIYTKS
ncbi:hypothetical protein FVER53590_01581 [Fusarium verticillioides]|nr:hypothetical protein FVER53590_01581 [Fusarium verticillioides]